MTRLAVFLICCIMLTTELSYSFAAQLRASFTDPSGDKLGNIDLTGFDFVFDNESGDFTGTLWADPQAPFRTGVFLGTSLDFIAALYVGNSNRSVSFSSPAILGFNAGFNGSSNSFTIAGTSESLIGWQPGDLVTANPNVDNRNAPYPLGWTGVRDYPISLGIWTMDDIPFGQYAALMAVPEPQATTLAIAGAVLLALTRPRSKG